MTIGYNGHTLTHIEKVKNKGSFIPMLKALDEEYKGYYHYYVFKDGIDVSNKFEI